MSQVQPSGIHLKRITKDLQADFLKVHCEEHALGWCRCVAWHVPSWDGWGERSASSNLALQTELLEEGLFDGYLMYAGDNPIGWCQCGPLEGFPKLCSQYGISAASGAWAITCLSIIPARRGLGFSHMAVEAVLEDLRCRGAQTAYAFPRRGAALPSEDVWTGPEAVFVRAGFQLIKPHDTHPIYSKAFDKSDMFEARD